MRAPYHSRQHVQYEVSFHRRVRSFTGKEGQSERPNHAAFMFHQTTFPRSYAQKSFAQCDLSCFQ
jgi:hypothetical protein